MGFRRDPLAHLVRSARVAAYVVHREWRQGLLVKIQMTDLDGNHKNRFYRQSPTADRGTTP